MENDALQRHYENLACEGGFEARCHMELPERSLVGARVVNVGCRRGKGTYKLSEQVGESLNQPSRVREDGPTDCKPLLSGSNKAYAYADASTRRKSIG